jgi:hypothetical protein
MTSIEPILINLKAQPKKTAVMCLLIVVLAVVVIRAFRGPETASGMVSSLLPPGAGTPGTQINGSEKRGEPDPLASDLLEATATKEPTAAPLPKRDIFAVNLDYFPHSAQTHATTPDRQKKIDAKQLLLNSLQDQLRAFQLQSTMTGPAPTAYIDGTLVREGQMFKGFKIRQIRDGKILLEAQGYLFSLFLNEK